MCFGHPKTKESEVDFYPAVNSGIQFLTLQSLSAGSLHSPLSL